MLGTLILVQKFSAQTKLMSRAPFPVYTYTQICFSVFCEFSAGRNDGI